MPKSRAIACEDVAGRANVEDTPELLAYYDQLEQLEAGALWTVANTIEPWQPKSSSVPVLWRYRDLRDHVLRSLDLVTPEKAGRRVIYLNNPGRREVSAAVGWLYSGLQVMRPGEVASAHAHSASALRFIMEGSGAYTIVDGHKVTLAANDFVLSCVHCKQTGIHRQLRLGAIQSWQVTLVQSGAKRIARCKLCGVPR